MAVFERLKGNEDRPFLVFSQEAIDVLEGITAADKAQAVPYVRIWHIDGRTGMPAHPSDTNPTEPRAPLNLQLVVPPSFGSSAEQRMRERPPVSLDRISIKTEAPRGIITYQKLELSFLVHRPDVIFGDPEPGMDSWSTLITPGLAHCIEYGWSASSGVRNGVLNGNGIDGLGDSPVVIPGRKRMRFVVTNYSFKVQPDGQIPINITAFEEGEFNLRQALVGGRELRAKAAETRTVVGPFGATTQVPKYEPQDLYDVVGREIVARLQATLIKVKETGGKHVGNDTLIRFQDLADIMFAPSIESALSDIGYTKIKLVMGYFNKRVGKTNGRYGLDSSGNGEFSIGDFKIPFGEIEKTFNTIVKSGAQITLYNFVNAFLNVMNRSNSWDRKRAKPDAGGMPTTRTPEVLVRTQLNPKSGAATFYIIDAGREFTQFSDSERKFEPGTSRSKIREYLRGKMPVVTFMRGNSYIQDSNFDVIADEQIKGIFMRRYLDPNRAGITVETDVKKKLSTTIDPREMLYSSAINGDLTLLGNFVFDLFGLIWLDFGIPRWDGPFAVKEREDVIDRTGFTTRISVIAEGTDPLGTQGRLDAVKRNAAVTALKEKDKGKKGR